MGLSQQKKKILVVGSLAYDHLMECKGHFRSLLVAGDSNIAITAHNRKISFGGCGGNIAYNLRLFDERPLLMTSVGKDFGEYKKWLKEQSVDVSGIYESTNQLTASAFIVTDPDENQIALFDAGAMDEFPKIQTLFGQSDLQEFAMAIIAPDNPERMMALAAECFEARIPYVFDPAQEIPHIEPKALERTLRQAKIVIVNTYESELLCTHLGITKEELFRIAPFFIQTKGAKGCVIKNHEENFTVPAVPPERVGDPTGCGDAFRAGVVAGLQRGFDLRKACQTGALTATYNLEQKGTQQHFFTLQDFRERFEQSFGVPF